ncbi:hypothetical protein CVT24_000258 [Panaeolus cyanescens]|uniref:Ketopantoate reductase C-terminal domain-containing protein n=1 Tax=Panaeolus cyanescens TaxID=181874 RepID=A0A409YD88_9AGAR|nr:hypothetical protein CVT24_000258 [Panaeolus cyanescens]
MGGTVCRSVEEAADQRYDYVVLTTKAIPEVVKTSKIFEPLLRKGYNEHFKQPTYVIMQNGLNVEVDLYNAIKALNKGEPKIISTAVYIGANMLEANLVEHNDFDRVFLGVYRHNDRLTSTNTPEELELLNGFSKLIESGGSTVAIVPEIQRVKFAKNFWNVAFSGMATLTQYTLPAIFRAPPDGTGESYSPYVCPDTAELIETYTIPLIKGIFEELITLARALGFPDAPGNEGISADTGTRILEGTKALHLRADSTHVPSMLLDLQKGLPIEVEVIVGEVVRMAKEVNVEVPRVETLYGLLLVVQNQILRKMKERPQGTSGAQD